MFAINNTLSVPLQHPECNGLNFLPLDTDSLANSGLSVRGRGNYWVFIKVLVVREPVLCKAFPQS